MKKFTNVNVYIKDKGIVKSDVVFDEKILSFDGGENAEVISLPENATVIPAFVDTHIHGAGGSDAMDGDLSALKTIAKTVAKEGTASFLATTMTQGVENITNALTAVKDYRQAGYDDGAEILGVHLEGPFISEKFKGAQPLEYVVKPDVNAFNKYHQASGECIKIVTLAPEVDGVKDLICYLDKIGVVPSVGHTSAKFDDINDGVKIGLKNVTHTFNAQTPLHHRDIGTVGSALLIDELQTEIIADTIHVSVPAIKLLVKNKPKNKINLITDAMRAKGMPDGESELGGQKVFVKNGEARLADGTLAGSVLTMNVAVKNMVEKVGVDFADAVDFATINPATSIGVQARKGSIEIGKDADFAVIDKDFNVLMTIRAGKIIYKA